MLCNFQSYRGICKNYVDQQWRAEIGSTDHHIIQEVVDLHHTSPVVAKEKEVMNQCPHEFVIGRNLGIQRWSNGIKSRVYDSGSGKWHQVLGTHRYRLSSDLPLRGGAEMAFVKWRGEVRIL